jgi:shikimate dehydrogenase
MILSGKTRVAGVMGWPVGHSRSPRLQNWWLERYQIDGAYIPLPVKPEDFAEALRALPKLGFAGVNVTVPHKEMAFAAVDETSPEAKRVGAVNTVIVKEDGQLFGHNSDGFGFIENLRAGAPNWQASDGPAVVLGAGGAARGICASLLDAGAPEIFLVNRSLAKAEKLADDLKGKITPLAWEKRNLALESATLLVNTTSLGMVGQSELEIDLSELPKSALVTDIVYTPLITGLLKAAKGRGNPIVDGLGMLLHQARPGFAAWFGREPEVTEELRAFMLESLK